MTVETVHFHPELLQRFLNADLSDEEQTACERHLELCDTCREQLQASAADDTWWEDASDFLQDDEFEINRTTDDSSLPTAIVDRVDGTEESTSADGIPANVRQIIAWLNPTDDPAMLGRLGGYEIAGVVGVGGMGVVLKGFDRSLNRYVAIKILAPHLATSGAARQQFAREAQAAAAVVHSNVVAIHGVDESNSLPYLVMPYLRGTSLQRRIDEHGALSVSEMLRLGMQTARGLAAAHDQGLVHRDVKPANILLDGTTERVLLTDFGLARAADDASLTQSGVIAGTPHFMSPEQAEGAAIDHRSDLFSLGSVLYAMCTGRPPFRADTSWGILRKVTDAQPHAIRDLNPDVPNWLCQIIERLLEKDSSRRFQSADEVAELLEQCLAHVQQPNDCKLPESLTTQVDRTAIQRFSRTRYRVIGMLALVVAVVVASQTLFPQLPPSDNTATKQADDAAPMSMAEEPLEIVDESLLDWDDADFGELSSIRNAIEKLDEESLQLIPVPRPNE
ncbi:serine/threonine-protein kinase [Fuerstiella marisgermanici]|uniref:non-specific serine/threonine protein kinase n=1 Tax=Fuerstiella marisgermanici TaxID=1891926 RepID=A0A1P8WLH1_9PLAN|nr:serine/threonine-protein kinase [Fuerstiella marisgermanici]APZ94908.1 Serine/threonine-protein kinase PrkC [Fuerstiella marisgermanici]